MFTYVDTTSLYSSWSADLSPQPVGARVEGALYFLNIYLGPDNLYRAQLRSMKLSTVGFHFDVSYEHRPPTITILTLLTLQSSGGDTGWASQVVAYERLSEPIKHLLEGLRVEHSKFPQADNARRDGKFVRREPVRSEHPTVRVRWEEGTVSLWDNRVTAHTAFSDYDVYNQGEGLRHGFIITVSGEKPVGVDGLTSSW